VVYIITLVSKGIMDLHHGSLSISSKGEGFGCTFTAILNAKYDRLLKSGSSRYINVSNPRLLGDVVNRFNLRNGVFSQIPITTKILPLYNTLATTSNSVYNADQHPSNNDECQSYTDAEPSLLKLLVVDDSTSNRKMLMRLLRDKCSLIDEAVDGIDAVNKIKSMLENNTSNDDNNNNNHNNNNSNNNNNNNNNHNNNNHIKNYYDAVLMDYVMPNMEGPEAVKCIRGLGYKGIIIGVTGNVIASDRDKFINNGANMVLTKPVDIKNLNKAFQLIKRMDI